MFKNFRDKIALSGVTVLCLGVALLIFTFVSAYGFLTQSLSILTSADLAQTFGSALVPLIATCIRLMYLGIMGWVASLITLRGVAIVTHTPQLPPLTPQKEPTTEQKVQPKLASQESKPEKATVEEPKEELKEKPKEEPKQKEPEVAVIPPEVIPETPVANA
jgi:hypothetical protein